MGEILAEGVLTGGACAGKTSALTALRRAYLEKGVRLILMPETASLVISAAAPDIGELYHEDKDVHDSVEEAMFYLQDYFEKTARKMASAFHEPCVILYDRGKIDVSTYMTSHKFSEILNTEKTTFEDIRDGYGFVIHMETSAIKVPHVYGYDNPARWETPDEAIASDNRTFSAWRGHPRLHFVPGRPSFEEKVSEVISIVESYS